MHWWGCTIYLPNGASIQYTYYPFQNSGLLKIEFSLPHILYGNNIQMVYDLEGAIDTANAMMPEIAGIPRLDLWIGLLYRLDVCYNFQVGELVPWYIKALGYLEYPYRTTRPYTSQGEEYRNSLVVLRAYDKARERKDNNDLAGAIAAWGILRAEAELKKLYLRKLTGCKKPTLRSISLPWAYDVIENELEELNLLGCSIGTYDLTFRKLREEWGTWEALALIGLLKTKMQYPSIELLAQDAHLHPNSIGRHIQKKFVEKGVPPTLTEYDEPLPPLVVDRQIPPDCTLNKRFLQ